MQCRTHSSELLNVWIGPTAGKS